MIRRLATIAVLSLASLAVPVAVFWPYASAEPQRRARVVETVVVAAVPPVMMDYVFPQGTTYWTNPIVVEGQVGMTLRGQRGNRGPSRMVYRGPPTLAPIQFIGCARCKLLDLEIVVEVPGVESHVLITNAVDPRTTGISTANLISNVRCPHVGSMHYPKRSFSVDSYAAGGKDANNEQHRFDRCVTFVYSEAAFYVRGSQCHQIIYDQCAATNYGPGRPIGLHAAEGGHFIWRDGYMGFNSVDFQFGASEQHSIIRGNRSEHSTQFCVMGTSGGAAVLSCSNIEWDGNPVAGKPIFDGWWPNAISIRDSWFAGVNGVCPTLRVRGYVPAGLGSFDLSNVLIRQHGGTVPTTPIVTCPTTGDVRAFGLKHQIIPATGPWVDKRITVNQSLGVQ